MQNTGTTAWGFTGGSGGGSGYVISGYTTVSSDTTVTIGSGGNGGASVTHTTNIGNDGSDGGSTSFGNILASGGGKGIGGNYVNSTTYLKQAGGTGGSAGGYCLCRLSRSILRFWIF